MEREFSCYHLVGSLTVIKDKQIIAILFATDAFFISEFKAINKYKDLVWEIQGAMNNNVVLNNAKVKAETILYGKKDDQEVIIRKQTFE